ncbi:hypothetical protein [Mycoplasma sp. 613B]
MKKRKLLFIGSSVTTLPTFFVISCVDKNQVSQKTPENKKEYKLENSKFLFKNNQSFIELTFNQELTGANTASIGLLNKNTEVKSFIEENIKNNLTNKIVFNLSKANIEKEQDFLVESILIDGTKVNLNKQIDFLSDEKVITDFNQEFNSQKNNLVFQTFNFYYSDDKNITKIKENDNESLLNKQNENYKKYLKTKENDDTITSASKKDLEINSNDLLFDEREVEVTEKYIALKFNQTNIYEFNQGKILVKNLNPLKPWSKVINLDYDIVAQEVRFLRSEIPANLNNLVFTAISINNKGKEFAFTSKVQFDLDNFKDKLTLKDFNVFKDEENKKVFGSISFDFSKEDIEKYKDKWFVISFHALRNEIKEVPWLPFDIRPEIVVPFSKLWKFSLDKLDENKRYEITNITVNEPYSLKEYNSINSIKDQINKEFAFNFNNYNWQDLGLKYNHNETLNVNNDNLITKRKDLIKDEIVSLWLDQNSKSSIPYSIQNFISYQEYLKQYQIYKGWLSDQNLPNKKDFSFINDKNEVMYANSISGREIINKTLFNFNSNRTQASITKELNRYKNLDKIQDENIILEFSFVLNTKIPYRVNDQKIDGWKTGAKINVFVPLKELKDKKHLNYLPFNFDFNFDDKKTNEKRYFELKEKFNFNASYNLEDNTVTFNVNSKNGNIKLYDDTTSHNFSQVDSAFISNSIFYVHWQSKQNQDNSITFEETPYKKETLITGDTEIINKPQDIYSFKTEIDDKNNNAKRLFKDDSSEALKETRSRSFALSRRGGTYNLIGKVKPNDPNDHRYYISTAWHVWNWDGGWRKDPFKTGSWWSQQEINHRDPKTNILTKWFHNPVFKVPVLTDKNETDKKQPILEDEHKYYGYFEHIFKIEEYMNFNDESSFPTFASFRNNLGKKVANDNVDKVNNSDYWYSKADLFIGIMDISYFENNYKLENLDQNTQLSDYQKEVVKFFLNWKNLKTLEISNTSNFISNIYNLNYTLASFPYYERTQTNDDPASPDKRSIRYREYLLGNSPHTNFGSSVITFPVNNKNETYYFKNSTYLFDRNNIDLSSGSSGTFAYDADGKLVSIFETISLNKNTDGSFNKFGSYIIDNQKYTYYGSGNHPTNPSSFYERTRLMSYLYPDKYESTDFSKKPDIYYELNPKN